MKLLAWLTEFFLGVFGITRPRPEQLRTANFLIGGLMLAVISALGVLIFLIFAF